MVPARINIVTLGVGDLGRSEEFYAALGWQRSSASNDSIVWFKTAGAVVGLFPRADLAADAGVTDSAPGFSGITLAINLESKDAVDAAMATAVEAGAAAVKPPVRAEWGGYSGYFADPDGFLWELAWNPFFPIGPDGLLQMP
jgi:predicted lactoylglutathione lyase